MAKLDKDSDEFLLGTIAATVTGTAEDVKAIRLDVGSLSSRITAVENRVEAIETSRETLVPQYTNFKHDTNNELQKLNAVNRRPKRTPYRRAKGTPFVKQRDGYGGRTVRAGCGVGRA